MLFRSVSQSRYESKELNKRLRKERHLQLEKLKLKELKLKVELMLKLLKQKHNLLQIKYIVDLFLHIDKNLVLVIAKFGTLSYVLLFGVVFMETGLVVTPFLPGDSLLFAAGALSAMGSLSIWILYGLMLVAAIIGDTANYWIGHRLGRGVFDKGSRFFKKEYLEEAEAFYAKYGGAAIFLGRFVPIVRTFVPFVAGVSVMSYRHFITYNIVGGFTWVSLFL